MVHTDQVEVSFRDVRAELQSRIRDLLHELLPNGHRRGIYYFARNPRRDDRHEGSFWIVAQGIAAGAWRDEATRDKGDVIDLVVYVRGLGNRLQGLQWARAWLGWDRTIDRARLEVKRKAREYYDAQEQAIADQKLVEERRHAFGLFLRAQADIRDTPVETYLAWRGIDLSWFDRLPGAIRYLKDARYTDEDGKQSYWPCMIAAMSGSNGRMAAVHRTFLAADGKGKAPVASPKKIWPRIKDAQAMIRLTKGASRLTPEEMMRRGKRETVIVTEGIENGLSIAMACPRYRIWAAGSLGNIANIPALKMISDLIIYGDNDDDQMARAGFERSLRILINRGFALRIARPEHFFKDANDKLRGIRR